MPYKNKESERAYRRRRRIVRLKDNPEKVRFQDWCRNLKIRFRISTDDYNKMLDLQGGVCAICRQPPGSHRLGVDHDHLCCLGKKSCGKCVRGLLCDNCNFMLAKAKDDTGRLRNAIRYLEIHIEQNR